uniref:BH4_AAA_HYDROXYL_2 domain-containing protein n=1 Tax=Angiostrongylus cantonensis TaxID=6313 RepID=A0A0K0DEK0_ANGCA
MTPEKNCSSEHATVEEVEELWIITYFDILRRLRTDIKLYEEEIEGFYVNQEKIYREYFFKSLLEILTPILGLEGLNELERADLTETKRMSAF